MSTAKATEKLWGSVSGKQLGVRFSRQAIIHGRNVDFWCHAENLAVGIRAAPDKDAEEFFRLRGIRYVEFLPEDIIKSVRTIITKIRSLFASKSVESGSGTPSRRDKEEKQSPDVPASSSSVYAFWSPYSGGGWTSDYDECHRKVNGVSGARCKKFGKEEDAVRWLSDIAKSGQRNEARKAKQLGKNKGRAYRFAQPPPKPIRLEFSEESKGFLEVLENGSENVFLTGKAGTGKTTLVRYFISNCKKNIAILAPTGVAAMQVGGQTIHSFFGFQPGLLLPGMGRAKKVDVSHNEIEMLVVDEISMCRADLFDSMDRFLRKYGPRKDMPFGGVRLICIGDLFQLPPVLKEDEESHHARVYPSRYFFGTKAYEEGAFRRLELTKVYRQSDNAFLDILNQIRTGHVTQASLDILNLRVASRPVAPEQSFITISTHNRIVDSINQKRLAQLPGEETVYEAVVEGNIFDSDVQVERELKLKEGAQIMFVRNDSEKRWVNGTLGRVTRLTPSSIEVTVGVKGGGSPVQVKQEVFEKIGYITEEGALKRVVVGTFTQFPLRLAWAITVHKSQGQTFNQVHLNLGTAFETGQVYVALSRCTSLEGLTLERPLSMRDILVDPKVTGFQYRTDSSIVSN